MNINCKDKLNVSEFIMEMIDCYPPDCIVQLVDDVSLTSINGILYAELEFSENSINISVLKDKLSKLDQSLYVIMDRDEGEGNLEFVTDSSGLYSNTNSVQYFCYSED